MFGFTHETGFTRHLVVRPQSIEESEAAISGSAENGSQSILIAGFDVYESLLPEEAARRHF
jgi:hypothetical protein